jgi:hypothetical protein
MFGRRNHDSDTIQAERHDEGEHRIEKPVNTREHAAYGQEAAHERYGGMNLGADLIGWLVALGIAVLLTGIIGAVVAAVREQTDISQSTAEREAGTIGVVAAVVLVVVMAIGYFTGGYVAGRMSRFDGGRQGLGVWGIGLLVMVVAAALGALFGRQYNVLDRVNLPQLPVSAEEASLGALVTGLVLLIVTLLAALAGGKVGRNYHRKVDAAHFR